MFILAEVFGTMILLAFGTGSVAQVHNGRT